MNDVELMGAVVGITEVVKNLGLPSKFCAPFAILLGVGLAVVAEIIYGGGNYFRALVRGIIFGTTATGIYSVGGKVVDKVKSQNANPRVQTQ